MRLRECILRDMELLHRRRGPRLRQQSIRLPLDHGVAFATHRFELWPVQYRDMPAAVVDRPGLLQLVLLIVN